MPKVIIITVFAIIIIIGGWFAFTVSTDKINTNVTLSNVVEPIANTNTTNSTVFTNTESSTNTTIVEPELTNTALETLVILGPDLGQAPDFSFQDFAGNTVSLADYRGRPVVLNTWAAWCPFCIKELPAFAAVQRELGEAITIIAIDRAESLGTAKSYTDDLGVTNDLTFLLDPSDSFYTSIGGFSMPETLLVDGDGIIRDHKRGTMDAAELKQRLSDNLGVN